MKVRKVSTLTSLGNGDIDMWYEQNYVLVIDELRNGYISMWGVKEILTMNGQSVFTQNLYFTRAYVVIPKKAKDIF